MKVYRLRRPLLGNEVHGQSEALDGIGCDPGGWFIVALPPAEIEGSKTGAARKSDPDTSQEAAKSMDPTAQERMVYDVLRAALPGDLILDEIWDRVDPTHAKGRDSWGPRLAPLIEKGLVVVTGKRMGSHKRNMRAYAAVVIEDVPSARNDAPEPELTGSTASTLF